MKVAFLVNDLSLSGGMGVVVTHARHLHDDHGFDVALVLVRNLEEPAWAHDKLPGLRVLPLAKAQQERFDVALSTWWETVFALFTVPAERHAQFVQSLEDRFYREHEIERAIASLVLDTPVSFVTEATWIQELLGDVRPDAPCHLVRNGIEKTSFPLVDAIDRDDARPLRILVEGYASTWFKGVNDAVAATRLMAEPHTLTVVAPNRDGLDTAGVDRVVGPLTTAEMAAAYAEADVLLKLSRVEGMYGPPLEAFHRGATCVTTEVTGFDEYIRHGENALVCDWDDLRGTARQLDLLARDRDLLHRLRTGALETARTWPDWTTQAAEMADALRTIREAPAPDPVPAAARMMADLRSATELLRLQLAERDELRWKLQRYERLRHAPGVRQLLHAKQSRPAQVVLKAMHPATKRAKRKLLGAG